MSTRERTRLPVSALVGVAVVLVLMAAAMIVPAVTGWNVRVRWFPPLHAQWSVRTGPGTIPAIVLALVAVRYALRASESWPWSRVLVGAFLFSVAWLISLATVDGLDGIGVILDTFYEYLRTARAVTDIPTTFNDYISRIPLDSVDNWPVHIAGHPAGALLFFVVLVSLGLGSGLAAGFVVIVLAATTPVAVLITLRRLGAETAARAAAPFLVFGSAAIWMAVSADALFGAVGAWGLCALAVAATTRGVSLIAYGILAGHLLGYCVMMSYGLPLLGILGVAILIAARNWRPLPWAIVAALAVVGAFAIAGFAWWEAYPVLVERYWDGIASRRPQSYWIWGNLAALGFSAGPLVGASIALVLTRTRRRRTLAAPERAVVLLTVAAVIIVLVADISGMSKAEVERIWLPFVPWLLLGSALLPERFRRGALGLQVGFALLVQHLLATGW